MKKLTQKSRIIVALTALLFIATLVLATSYHILPFSLWTQHAIPKTTISLTAVPLGTINKPIAISRTGSIESSISVPINADFTGGISEIYVSEGQVVKAGQPLFKLLGSSSEPIVNQPIGDSQQAQTTYDNALNDFNRYQKLSEIGAIPRRQFEMAAAHLQEAKENLASAQNTMPSSNAIINGSAIINAPIDGIVTGLSTSPGKDVQAGQQLLSLGSGQDVEAVAPLEQNDLYLVHLGTPVTIEAANQTIVGQVSRIYPLIGENQIPSFLAHIKLTTNPEGLLKSGMPVTIRIDTGKASVVPAVPTASIFQDAEGRNLIYMAVDGKAVLQQVSIEETMGDLTELTSELPQQSMVIISNIQDIKNGDAITVIP